MSYMTITLNSFTPVSEPTIVNGVAIDGYVGDQPVQLRKMRDNMIMPAIGTTVHLPYGKATVTGYVDEMLKVNVTEFNDDYEFITADETNIYDAEEMVAKLNRCLQMSLASDRSDFERFYASETTGKLSEKKLEQMYERFPSPLPTEIVVGFKGDYLHPTDSIVVKRIDSVQRLTRAEKARQRRLEIAQAKRLADALLGEDTDVPDDVQAELDEMFGTMD